MKIITAPRRGTLKMRLGFAAAFFAAVLSSCDQSPLSKDTIRKSLMERAERNKQPLMIDSISDVQTMTLHGEKCSTAMAYVKGPLGLSMPIYFVCKEGSQNYVSGGGDLIKQIDEKGYDAVFAQLPQENPVDSSPTPSATAEAQRSAIPASTAAPTPDVKQALADDDKSDLSNCSDDDLTVIAQLAAKSYLKKHPRIYSEMDDRDLSIRVGMQHNLFGDSLFRYRREWLGIIVALSKAEPDGATKPSSTPRPEPVVNVTPTPIVETTPVPTPTAGTVTANDTAPVPRASLVATPAPSAEAEYIPDPTDKQATAAFNDLQDQFHRPHATSVVYSSLTDSYNWIGPKTGRKMSMKRSQFIAEIWTGYYKKVNGPTQ
jgi:hypothetical protein